MLTDDELLKAISRESKEAEVHEDDAKLSMEESRRLTSYIRELMAEEFEYRKSAREARRGARKHRRAAKKYSRQYDRYEYATAKKTTVI